MNTVIFLVVISLLIYGTGIMLKYRFYKKLLQEQAHPLVRGERGRRRVCKVLFAEGLYTLGCILCIITLVYTLGYGELVGKSDMILKLMCFTGLMCSIMGFWINLRRRLGPILCLIYESIRREN